MASQVPYARPEESGRNYVTTGAVTGGRLVEYTGDKTVAHAAANSVKVAGWCPYDVASGGLAPVYRDGVVPCIASGAIAAGQRVVAGAAGVVVGLAAAGGAYAQAEAVGGRAVIGWAEAAAADTATVPIVLNIQ